MPVNQSWLGWQVRRVERRVAHLGLEVVGRSEEEYSVIPMGGPLPVLGQPTVPPLSSHPIKPAAHLALSQSPHRLFPLREFDSNPTAPKMAYQST